MAKKDQVKDEAVEIPAIESVLGDASAIDADGAKEHNEGEIEDFGADLPQEVKGHTPRSGGRYKKVDGKLIRN